jgi:predicted ATP-dependent endonuclease of OLD family
MGRGMLKFSLSNNCSGERYEYNRDIISDLLNRKLVTLDSNVTFYYEGCKRYNANLGACIFVIADHQMILHYDSINNLLENLIEFISVNEDQPWQIRDRKTTGLIYNYKEEIFGEVLVDYYIRVKCRFGFDFRKDLFDKILQSNYSVFVGENNVGKSFILKLFSILLFKRAVLLLPNRFFSNCYFKSDNTNDTDYDYANYDSRINGLPNIDNSMLNMQSLFARLLEKENLSKFKQVIGHFGFLEIEILNTESGFILSIDGIKLIDCSTGVKFLVQTVLVLLFLDSEYVLIDEPEMSFYPRLQTKIAELFKSEISMKEYFGDKAKRLIIATHSNVFLDRSNLENNYQLYRIDSNEVNFKQVTSISEFNYINFELLGYDMGNFNLPNLLIFVEGPSDQIFWRKIVELKWPNKKILVVNCLNDDGTSKLVSHFEQFVGQFDNTNTYLGKIIVLLDNANTAKFTKRISDFLNAYDNFYEFEKNGIEYYYLSSIISELFDVDSDKYLLIVNSVNDGIKDQKKKSFEFNDGKKYGKPKLAELVSEKITIENIEQHDKEVIEIVSKIESLLTNKN